MEIDTCSETPQVRSRNYQQLLKEQPAKETERVRIYYSNIEGRGGTKIPDLNVRTAEMDFKVLCETNCRPGCENSINLNSQAVALVADQLGFDHEKEKGFGTAVMAKHYDASTDEIIKSNRHEIAGIAKRIGKRTKMCVIGAYRSPSLRVPETKDFYLTLRNVVQDRQKAGDDIIIVAMDDNSSDKSKRPFLELEKFRNLLGGVHVIDEPTRKGKTQPDHVVAFYDPMRFTVSGMVLPGVGDHDACVMDVEMEGVINIKPKWSNKKKVLVDQGDIPTIISELKEEFTDVSPEALDFLEAHEEAFGIPSLDELADIFLKRVERVRERHAVYVERNMPEHKASKCKQTREVQYELNRVYTAACRLRKDPTNQALKKCLIGKKENYKRACAKAAQKIIERDISKMRKHQRVNTRRFFAATGMHLKFDGVAAALSRDEAMQRIKETELNYGLRGDPATLDHLKGIIKTHPFEIKTRTRRS